MSSSKNVPKTAQRQNGVARLKEEQELKDRLLKGPELFIPEKGSDAYLDTLALKIKLIGGAEFTLSDYVGEVMAEYESKFSKAWFYRLADLYRLEHRIMDAYVKPEFVRQFIVQFVYGRFPYMLLRTLRSKNRKTSSDKNRTKLFQHLTKSASKNLDAVIDQVYMMMGQCETALEFKMRYSAEYKVYFQVEMEF